jgi:hypothetical protein
VAGCRKVETPALGETQGRDDRAGHHRGMGVGAEHLLQRPQRLLVGARLDQHEPTWIEPGLAKSTAIGPPEIGECPTGCDQEVGAPPGPPLPALGGERGPRVDALASNAIAISAATKPNAAG